jgi:hypothetical protein
LLVSAPFFDRVDAIGVKGEMILMAATAAYGSS